LVSLVVLGLAMAAALALFAWFSLRYASFWHNRLVNDSFAAVNEIVMTGDVPARWRLRPVERLVRRYPDAPSWRRVHTLLYRWYIFRLDRLTHNIAISSVIRKADKAEFIETLGEARDEWLRRSASISGS
jgi:hypothetical protein